MADMRLGDWITIFATLGTLVLCLFAGVILIAAWPRIVSTVLSIGARARAEGAARRAYRQQVYDRALMPSRAAIAGIVPSDGSNRSYAVEPSWDRDGSPAAFQTPTIAELLEQLSDDDLLAELALMKDANGNPKYADSRIAKFIGGRVEDRVAQVRDVRGTEAPPPKRAAQLRVRDNGHERLIAKYGDKRPA
jgi:hypothetical protein